MNKKSITLTLFLVAALLIACAPSQAAIQTAISQTQTASTPDMNDPAMQAIQTAIVGTSVAALAHDKNTPPAPSTNPLTSPHRDGFFLVGVDIAPGVWRSSGTQTDCYWKVSKRNGDTIDNFFGMAGGAVHISADAYQVQFDGCGSWNYLGPP